MTKKVLIVSINTKTNLQTSVPLFAFALVTKLEAIEF